MTESDLADPSNGWEAAAARLIAGRSQIGASTIRSWSAGLPRGARVLDLGCGAGVPVSAVLVEAGFDVYAIDAAPSLVDAYRMRFPSAHVECATVERSSFFGRSFNGVVAIGLLFLLPAEQQRALIRKVATALKPAGRFLFTSPAVAASWRDLTTDRVSVSLGSAGYGRALADAGMQIVGQFADEGSNHYYDARFPAASSRRAGRRGGRENRRTES